VDPWRDTKASRPSAKGSAAAAVMPPPAAPTTVTRRVSSLVKDAEVAGAKGAEIGGSGEASRELSMDDYLIEYVGMFDAHTGLAVGGECVYCCKSL
jgi:hypothetical protein